MELPQQLRENRERLGLSQEEVARRIFVSRQTISSWENGKTYPDVQSLLLLSKLFGVSIDELVKGDVTIMKDVVSKDALKMERLSWLEMFLILIAVMIAAIGSWHFRDDMSGIGPFVVLLVSLAFLGGALACAIKIERIKKSHDLVSFKEIVAFSNGDDVESIKTTYPTPFSRKHPAFAFVLKFLLGGAVGISLVLISKLVLFYIVGW